MNKFYLLLFSLVVSLSSDLASPQTISLTPLETLQKILPPQMAVRPKLSLKENLATILAELEILSQSSSGWSPQQDKQLLSALLSNKDTFLIESGPRLEAYFTSRMKKTFLDKPADLWEHYTLVSKLFPERNFWISFYESLLSQPHLNWPSVPNSEWIGNTLIPRLLTEKTSTSTWNKDILLNLLGFLKFQWSHTQTVINSASDFKAFIDLLEVIDRFFELTDTRLQTISPADLFEVAKQYFDFLQTMTVEWNQVSALNYLTSNPSFHSLALESVTMSSFSLAAQDHRIHLKMDTPRLKSFLALHDDSTQWIEKKSLDVSDTQRLRFAMSTVFYLRALIALKTTLSNETQIIAKGLWITGKQLQSGLELVWHAELLKAQNEVLRITQLMLYNLSLIDKCYRDMLQTPTCQLWRETIPLQLKEVIDEAGLKKKVWELNSKLPLQIPPGTLAFAPTESLRIIAPEIRFSLFSRISIPSGTVEIQTNKISFAWIDVSGSNASSGVATRGFPGQRPWIKNSKLCSIRDYLDGVTFTTLPHRKKVDWVGFSIKNPFPKNTFVCASHVQLESKDLVGDVDQLIDLGMAPESTEDTVPIKGNPGGNIRVELLSNAEKSPMIFPLLSAMGGDGSPGRDGQPSPLCHQNQYQSFKIGLSHHKEWFQRWLTAQETHPHLKLISKDEFGDHWYGLFEINLPQTSGSNGGDAGAGGKITLKFETMPSAFNRHRWFLAGGLPGEGGKAGGCGPNPAHEGQKGQMAPNGTIQLLNK